MSTYPLATTTWDGAELSALSRVIDSGQFTMGHEVASFERELAEFFGASHCIMFNSGSSANLAALAAMKFKLDLEGDDRHEVIVPMVSWSTTFFPVNQVGLTLKFVDVDLGDLNIDLDAVAEAIGPATAGILAVNLLGNPARLQELKKLAEAHRIFLIEDNCESMGAMVGGRFCGTFGEIGTFSTFYSHHISTMEGGFCLTDDSELSEYLLAVRAHGWTRNLPPHSKLRPRNQDPWEEKFTFVMPGYNLRPLEMEAAVGREQLGKLPGIITGRRTNAEIFKKMISSFDEVITQRENHFSSWFGFSLILSPTYFDRSSRSALVQLLSRAGIESRPIVTGNFLRQPVIRHLNLSSVGSSANADIVHDFGLFVGNHHYGIEEELGLLYSTLSSFLDQVAGTRVL